MMESLKKYGKWIAVLGVLALTVYLVYYFFFSDSASSAAYKPSANALDLAKNNSGWEQPNGSGAWLFSRYLCPGGSTVAGDPCAKVPGFYSSNERKVHGWFKGLNINPNGRSEYFWQQAAAEIQAYLATEAAKDFDSIKAGAFLPNSVKS